MQRDMLMEMRWKALREDGEEDIENNVFSFSELAGYEVLDPYGKDIDCYRYVYELIAGGMSAIIEKILPVSVQKKMIEKRVLAVKCSVSHCFSLIIPNHRNRMKNTYVAVTTHRTII